VDVVQVPGSVVTMSVHLHERFEVCRLLFSGMLVLNQARTGQ
jgi:hypothetical protein